jgi:Protein of unknown function (DUF3485)
VRKVQETEVCPTHESTVLNGVLKLTNEVTLGEFWCVRAIVSSWDCRASQEKFGQRQLVLYWFQAHGRTVASEYWAKYYLVYDSIRMNRSDGALVRMMPPCSTASLPRTRGSSFALLLLT